MTKTRGTGKKNVFKASFDSPYHQWPKVDASQGIELLRRLLQDLSCYTSHFVRSRTSKKDLGQRSTKRQKVEEESPLIIGLNECMRALKRDMLACVVVCKDDVAHARIFHHLPFWCRLKGTMVVPLPKGSAGELATLLGIPSVIVLGLKRYDSRLNELLAFFENRVTNSDLDLSQYQNLVVNKAAITVKKSEK